MPRAEDHTHPPVIDPTSAVQMASTLATINTKVDAILTGDKDHEQRIRRLERALYLGIGASTAFGTIAGSVVATLLQQLGR